MGQRDADVMTLADAEAEEMGSDERIVWVGHKDTLDLLDVFGHAA